MPARSWSRAVVRRAGRLPGKLLNSCPARRYQGLANPRAHVGLRLVGVASGAVQAPRPITAGHRETSPGARQRSLPFAAECISDGIDGIGRASIAVAGSLASNSREDAPECSLPERRLRQGTQGQACSSCECRQNRSSTANRKPDIELRDHDPVGAAIPGGQERRWSPRVRSDGAWWQHSPVCWQA